MNCSLCGNDFHRSEEEAEEGIDICPDCDDVLNYGQDSDIIAYGYDGDCF